MILLNLIEDLRSFRFLHFLTFNSHLIVICKSFAWRLKDGCTYHCVKSVHVRTCKVFKRFLCFEIGKWECDELYRTFYQGLLYIISFIDGFQYLQSSARARATLTSSMNFELKKMQGGRGDICFSRKYVTPKCKYSKDSKFFR